MQLAPRHILVVDDRPEVGEVVQRGLENLGHYRVSSAETGDQALPFFDTDRPDLVVLDAVLPGMSGIELAARAVCRDIPVLVMTGEPAMDARLEGVGWPHLRKPFRLETLLLEVEATLAQAAEHKRLVRASLDRLCQTSGDLQQAIDRLVELRQRTQQSLERSRKL